MHFFCPPAVSALIERALTQSELLVRPHKHELVTIGCIKAKVHYAILLASQLASWFASTT